MNKEDYLPDEESIEVRFIYWNGKEFVFKDTIAIFDNHIDADNFLEKNVIHWSKTYRDCLIIQSENYCKLYIPLEGEEMTYCLLKEDK